MNYVVLTGTIIGDIDSLISDNGMRQTKFNIKNLYYKSNTSTSERTIIRCIAYGSLAEYINNELYEGANIIVTGRVLSRTYEANNTKINRLYVGCNTVSLLEQEEYS